MKRYCEYLILQFAETCHSLDKRVLAKMSEWVTEGVVKIAEMKRNIRIYLSTHLFRDQALPEESNTRYWPSHKTILNCIYRTKTRNR